MQGIESVPGHLAPAAQAALSWVNDSRGANYELTGLVGVEEIDNTNQPFEMGLVLCDGEICSREQVGVVPERDAYRFYFVDQADPDIPPLLDPPERLRSKWLDQQLPSSTWPIKKSGQIWIREHWWELAPNLVPIQEPGS